MTGSHASLPRPDRKIDKSVTDLLCKDGALGGLKNDYSEQV